MGELRKKLKNLIVFLAGELILFGSAGVFAVISEGIPLSETAKFLGASVLMHLAAAWIELKAWKKESQKMSGYLDAKV